ncbi:MAG TPA: LuxR C-terminal-related transcriptional regulator [Saprospiraceae bacterium]|nr:LuxR C-terminal-related transcriptional regulator [Saprospiraceae bacterium]
MRKLFVISESRLYAEGLLALLDNKSKYLRGEKGLVADFDLFLRKDFTECPQILLVVLKRKKQLELLHAFKNRLSQSCTAIIADQHLEYNQKLLAPFRFDIFCSDQSLGEVFVRKVDQLLESKLLDGELAFKSTDFHSSNDDYALTARERQVLYLISRSYSNKEIGKSLYISDQTVSVHRRNLMKKLGAHNAAGLISKAFRERLIQL